MAGSLNWCRQRLLVAGNPLTATLPFVEPDHRDAIVALRCLISEIAAGAGGVSEPEVGLAKLEWWRGALREDNPHPAVMAFRDTGVSQRLPATEFDPLIEAVVELLENPRFESTDSAWQFCERLGGQASTLEARLLDEEAASATAFSQTGAAAYLIRIVRDLAVDARSNRWLVPLDLQADFQVSRQDAMGETAGPSFDGLVRAMLSQALKRGQSAVEELRSDQAWRHRNLLMHWALDRRLAGVLARRPQRILQRRVLPGHAGNVWCAWRQARRLRRNLKA